MIRIIPRFYPLMLKSYFNSGDIFSETTQVVLAFARDNDARVVASFSLFTCLSRSENVGNQYIDFVSNKSVGSPSSRCARCARGSLGKVVKECQTYSNTTTVTQNSCTLDKNEEETHSIVKAAALKRQFKNPRCLYSNSRDARNEVIYSFYFISKEKNLSGTNIFYCCHRKKFVFFQSIQVQLFRDQIY